MSRFFELPGNLADDLWAAVTSQPPALTDAVALAVRKALETSTATPPAPPVQHTPPPPWGAPAQPLNPTPAPDPAAALREQQLSMAAKGTVGKGAPPPIVPKKSFNPVLSQAGIAQVWYYDEPNGGWPAPIANQDAPQPTDVYFHTNPTGDGYWTTKAAVDAMPPPTVTTDWAAVNERMRQQPPPAAPPSQGVPPIEEGGGAP